MTSNTSRDCDPENCVIRWASDNSLVIISTRLLNLCCICCKSVLKLISSTSLSITPAFWSPESSCCSVGFADDGCGSESLPWHSPCSSRGAGEFQSSPLGLMSWHPRIPNLPRPSWAGWDVDLANGFSKVRNSELESWLQPCSWGRMGIWAGALVSSSLKGSIIRLA